MKLRSLVSWALALLFLLAAYGKFGDLLAFTAALAALDLGIPQEALPFVARLVPWVEVVTAVALLVPRLRGAGALLGSGSVVAFSGVVALLMSRRVEVRCPCFGDLDLLCSGPLGMCHLLRNVVLLAICFWVALTTIRVDSRTMRP